MSKVRARIFSKEIKLSAVSRMHSGENVSALARELSVRRKLLYELGIPFTQVKKSGNVGGWKMRDTRFQGLITRGRSRRWIIGSAPRRDAGIMCGGCVGRRGSFAGDAERLGSRG